MAKQRKQAQDSEADERLSKVTARSSSPNTSRATSPSTESDRPIGPLSISVPPTSREIVKVNNVNTTELKYACDDAVKRYLARPELFKQDHLHMDVRLGLGWLSVFVAAGTALYGYKIDFEQSKSVVSLGLVTYVLLTAIQTLYGYFIEGNTIFIGKRKSFAKRIINEKIQINSSTVPPSAQSPKSVSSSPANAPSYQLSVSYVRSTNGGKTLLTKGRTKAAQSYATFFDEQGVMDQEAFERWVGELVETGIDGKTA